MSAFALAPAADEMGGIYNELIGIAHFHFDGQVRAAFIHRDIRIPPPGIPTPATRYGSFEPSQWGVTTPGQALVGWFTYDQLDQDLPHYINNPNRAIPIDLTQPIPPGIIPPDGILRLYASWLPYGDLNGDGRVTMADLNIMQAYWGMQITRDQFIVTTADVNADGRFTLADLIIFEQFFIRNPNIILGPRPPVG